MCFSSSQEKERMQLRSGRNTVPNGKSSWPTEDQVTHYSTSTHDSTQFIEHINWLMSHCHGILVILATAQSLMNVSDDVYMRIKFRPLTYVVIEKLDEYKGPEVHEFAAKFSRLLLGVCK